MEKFYVIDDVFFNFFRIFVPKMLQLTKFVARTLSFRLSLMVLVALAILLMVALFVVFGYSRKAVREEALAKAEQTLETVVQRIDNILLDVEQSSGNIYCKMLLHTNEPNMMDTCCRTLVEREPYIAGCAIAYEPGFFKNHPEGFMVYYHRSANENGVGVGPIQRTDTLGTLPYNEQNWYVNTIKARAPFWTDPWDDSQQQSYTSFCLPIQIGDKRVGVMVVDISLTSLSKIVLETKVSPNSFCTLLGKDGRYIVHPDSSKLNKDVLELSRKSSDPSVREVAQAMLAGETGNKYVRLHDEDCYVFYKPFERSAVAGRSMEKLGWSAGIIYPADDIFGDYRRLHYTVLIIAGVGLLLLLLLCQTFIHRQLLPLRMLSKSAQRIAEGHHDETIPDSRQQDEVGRLQNHFQRMQQSLGVHVSEMKQLSDTLQERGEVLQAAYEQAQAADRMKTQFLYNMSNQMMSPVKSIFSDVMTINDSYDKLTDEDCNQLADNIQQKGDKITGLLNQLIAESEKKKGVTKETDA